LAGAFAHALLQFLVGKFFMRVAFQFTRVN
jgi:hypothetical protein